MNYIQLDDTVKYPAPNVVLDLDNNGSFDLLFGIQLVGDPIYKLDMWRYVVISSLTTALPVDENEQLPVLNKNDSIPIADFNGHNWYGASEIVLIQKNIPETGSITWVGNWLNASKKYLPFQLTKSGKRYSGWIEITEDRTHDQLILHRAALSKIPDVTIKSGN